MFPHKDGMNLSPQTAATAAFQNIKNEEHFKWPENMTKIVDFEHSGNKMKEGHKVNSWKNISGAYPALLHACNNSGIAVEGHTKENLPQIIEIISLYRMKVSLMSLQCLVHQAPLQMLDCERLCKKTSTFPKGHCKMGVHNSSGLEELLGTICGDKGLTRTILIQLYQFQTPIEEAQKLSSCYS